MDRLAQGHGRCMVFARPEFSVRVLFSLLMAGSSLALLGSSSSAEAEDRVFVWTGDYNGTSFGQAGNWQPVWGSDEDPILDGDGNPIIDQPGWIQGPPDGLDTMVVTTGTPNQSGQPRSVRDVHLSGGEFIVRNSKRNVSNFFVDGTLDVSGTGSLVIDEGEFGDSVLTAASVEMSGGSIGGWRNTETEAIQSGLLVVTDSMVQSGGSVSGVAIQTPSYALSGGTLSSDVEFASLFALSGAGTVESGANLTGTEGSAMTQSGGVMDGTVAGIHSYTHSGGNLGGTVTTGVYALTDAAATSDGGIIDASQSFDLAPATGTATIAAQLTGEGNLIKTGASTVILANGDNDFTGAVVIDAGTLEIIDDALPDHAGISVAGGATLLMNAANDTVFMGTIQGEAGALVKQGSAALTLGADVTLGGLTIHAGKVQVGTGLAGNTASFDHALVQVGATLHVASGATLTIRIPNNLVNHGILINEGTINDDLENTGTFDNDSENNANVLSNSGTINNNAGGVWTGDILDNEGTINNAEGAEWIGDVVSNGGVGPFVPIFNRGTWTGDVRNNSGFIGNADGTWTGNILANEGGVINNATWEGDIRSNESQIINEDGTWNGDIASNNNLIVNKANSDWNGAVLDNGGSNNDAQIVNHGLWTGDVEDNSGLIRNWGGSWEGNIAGNTGRIENTGSWTGDIEGTDSQIGNSGTWTGDILGNNNAIFNEAGGLWIGDVVANEGGDNQLTQIDNEGEWFGDVQTNAHAIYNENGGIWNGDVLSNAGLVWTSGVWNGDFTSAGSVIARGEINGAFANSGTLRVTGTLGGITTLTNSGTVSLLGNGATQVLTADNVAFSEGSFFDIDVDTTGASDRIVAQNAVIDGGTVRVTAASTGGPYDPSTSYTILTAETISGEFDAVATDLGFLSARLGYEDEAVLLTLKRNDIGFGDIGITPNQRAAAAGAESLGTGSAIYDAILWLSQDEARQAFDHLSGEAHGSFDSVSIQSANIIAEMVTARLDRAFDAADDDMPMPVLAYAAGAGFPRDAQRGNLGIWAGLYGALGHLSGTGNSHETDSTMAGVAGGFDALLGDWRVGGMLHAGRTEADVDALNTSGSSTDYGVGIYGGRQWGETRFSLGAAYTQHDWNISRSVGFPGFADTLSAEYSTGTAQAFGKLSHAIRMGEVSLVPYASLAYVNQAAHDFTETGGVAALEGTSDSIDALFTTLGLGGNRTFAVGDARVTAKAGLGWRHAHMDAPGGTRMLAAGESFLITGAPVPEDAIVINAGLAVDLGADTMVDVSYDGQIGKDGAGTHILKGVLARRF